MVDDYGAMCVMVFFSLHKGCEGCSKFLTESLIMGRSNALGDFHSFVMMPKNEPGMIATMVPLCAHALCEIHHFFHDLQRVFFPRWFPKIESFMQVLSFVLSSHSAFHNQV